ncbi:MAG TPA: flagellar basal body P-ring formation chaperone FlgA [Bryobacteraceae bacterium]|nr:flagellar basal body P-ring formation chaperone FlgA [Bryobacteraceae bacterium]HPT27963.1 flagellar basal body P-ring formation chaperone FlgA [Bryobacteraceae bacterium]
MTKLLAALAIGLALPAAKAECAKVDSGRILARDLAVVAPSMAGLPPDTVIGFSPKLGLVRWLAPDQLQRIAARHSASIDLKEPVCVERFGVQLDPRELRNALAAALQRAGHAKFALNVVEYPRGPLPRGVLEFSASGLSAPRSGKREALWRGRLRVEGGQSVPVVVRVEVSVDALELRAARDLAPGQVILAEDLSQSTRPVTPGSAPAPVSPNDAIGKQVRRAIRAGGLVVPELLSTPPEIQRGDRVLVAVASGRAAIGVEAKADNAARMGEMVVLTNPASGKRFKASVTGPGRAAIRLETSNDETTPAKTTPAKTTPAAGADRTVRPGGHQEQTAAAAVGAGPDHR